MTGTLAAMLPMCMSNFKVMQSFKLPISGLRDFTRSYDETSYQILKWDPGSSLVGAIQVPSIYTTDADCLPTGSEQNPVIS